MHTAQHKTSNPPKQNREEEPKKVITPRGRGKTRYSEEQNEVFYPDREKK